MHESAQRLYEEVRKIAGVIGQSAVGRFLNVSPQVMKNWELRGVSESGAINLQRALGVSCVWILDGTGPVRVGDITIEAPSLTGAMEVLGMALAADMPDEVRSDVGDALEKLAERRGAARDQARVISLLTEPAQSVKQIAA